MKSIIIAEDDPNLIRIYRELLTKRGYDCRVCEYGEQVIPEHRKQPADIFILDLGLPGKSGLEVCHDLRHNPDSYNLPIIIASVYDNENIITDGFDAGADDYIIKPFKPAILLAKIANHLKKISPSDDVDNLVIGSLFAGRHKLIRKIGSGGFSRVYLADDMGSDTPRKEALKIFDLPKSKQNDQDFMALFLREAYGLSKIDHPNIIKLYDFGHFDRFYFLAVEYVEGETLHNAVNRKGVLSENDAIVIGLGIARALRYLDNRSYIHRDIKPSNIMTVGDNHAKLIDFGMARLTKDETVTTAGIFTGTPQFAAPECIRIENEIDIKSDIFSLGATLYYSVTGILPFTGDNSQEIFRSRYSQRVDVPPVEKHDPKLTREFSQLINNMLDYNPTNRPMPVTIVKRLRQLASADKYIRKINHDR